MKKQARTSNILILLSITAFPLAALLIFKLSDVSVFDTIGLVKYTWIFWLFSIIPLVSLLYGFYLKRKGNPKHSQNFTVSVLILPVMLLFGCFWLKCADTYDSSYDIVKITEEKTNIDLPDDIKVINEYLTDFTISRVRLESESEKQHFEEQIQNDEIWVEIISNKLLNNLPPSIKSSIKYKFDLFVFYNETTNEYNKYPIEPGEYKCSLIAYNANSGSFIIINSLILTNV